jgi:DNA repair exonuclease SbcCD ATPase subunit
MRFLIKIIACLLLLATPVVAQADEKTKAQSQVEAAKAAVEAFARKSKEDKLVARDIEAARAALKRSEEVLANNRPMFGLGDISPEAATSVKHLTDLVDMHLTQGQSRLDSAKATEELSVLSGQLAKVRAKVKVFEDRKAELERLRAVQGKHEALVKEMERLKAENERLAAKEAKLLDGQKALSIEIDYLKAELAKRPAATPAPEAAAAEAAAPEAKK